MDVWSESPFLDQHVEAQNNHLPIYGPPADANSFVYAPGLEYLCYAILRPFGLDRMIRAQPAHHCCFFWILAAGCGAWLTSKVARPPANRRAGRIDLSRSPVFHPAMVSSRGFTWDICHPDNLHVFRALFLFCLCFAALETKRYSLALATLSLKRALGVFTNKPKPHRLLDRRSFLRAIIPGAGDGGFSPLFWRAATWRSGSICSWLPFAICALASGDELLSRHKIDFGKLFVIYIALIYDERGLVLYLAIISGFYLWTASETARRYVTAWIALGIFCVLPNTVAYIKQNGGYNNLILFEVWMALLIWPFVLHLFDKLRQPEPNGSGNRGFSFVPAALSVLLVILVVLLFPMRRIPGPDYYQYWSSTIEDSVRK